MRELKFRAWNKNKYIELTNLRGEKSIYFSPYDLGVITQSIDRKEVVLEQYTGLKDKNGKEIYEGDIIEQFVCGVRKFKGKECGRRTVWQVRWNEAECCFELHYIRGSLFGDSLMSNDDEYGVIGNIHENPELLGGEK